MIPITTAKSITNVETRALKDYMKDMSRFKVLTLEQEKELGRRSKSGDKKAIDRLVEANLRFAITVAKHYQGRGLTLEELIAEANTGLCIAAHKWDVDLGYRFITCALWWMRQTVTKALTNKSRTIRVSQVPVTIQFRINKQKQKYYQEHEHMPSDDELAKLCNCTVRQLHNAMNAEFDLCSIDDNNESFDCETPLFVEVIEDPNSEKADTKTYKENRRETILNILNSADFTPMERNVILDAFGFSTKDNSNISFRDMTKKYGLSCEALHRIKKRAMNKLRSNYTMSLKSIDNNEN